MISAMTTLLLLLILATVLAALVAWTRHDGLAAPHRTAWFD